MPIRILYKKIETPFKYPFTISKGTKTHQPSLLVQLQLGNLTGLGEAPAINYYNITVEDMMADIAKKKPFIEKFAFTTPDRYWHYLHHLFPANPFLVSALDMASWDMYGKLKKLPLYQLWQTKLKDAPVTDYTIGLDTVEKMIAKLQEKPWPVYKIKLGSREDIAIMQALRQVTNVPFRVDANAGWAVDDALVLLPELEKLNVELIEQPLAKENREGMLILKEKTSIPFFADESCVAEQDVKNCAQYFDGVNIKLTKCSGITPALRMITEAKSLNLKVMLGCMNETTVGIAALAHLSPQADYLDADGPLLLSNDIASGVFYQEGKVVPSPLPGLGIYLL